MITARDIYDSDKFDSSYYGFIINLMKLQEYNPILSFNSDFFIFCYACKPPDFLWLLFVFILEGTVAIIYYSHYFY